MFSGSKSNKKLIYMLNILKKVTNQPTLLVKGDMNPLYFGPMVKNNVQVGDRVSYWVSGSGDQGADMSGLEL